MPEKIIFTKNASNDLDCIKKYIYDDNAKIAKEVVKHILSNIEQLLLTPNIGRAGRILHTRELVIIKYPYIVPYQVKNNIIYVLRILHTSRKWE